MIPRGALVVIHKCLRNTVITPRSHALRGNESKISLFWTLFASIWCNLQHFQIQLITKIATMLIETMAWQECKLCLPAQAKPALQRQWWHSLLMVSSTLSDFMITQFKIVIPAGIAGIQAPGMDFSLPSMALDTRFPAGMTSLRIIWQSRISN